MFGKMSKLLFSIQQMVIFTAKHFDYMQPQLMAFESYGRGEDYLVFQSVWL